MLMTTALFASGTRIVRRIAATLTLILVTIATPLDAATLLPLVLGDEAATFPTLAVDPLGNHMLLLTMSAALPGAMFDVYFINDLSAQRWQWRRVCNGIQCDGN